MDCFFSFLLRRTDFYYEAAPGAKMGFPPGYAEGMVSTDFIVGDQFRVLRVILAVLGLQLLQTLPRGALQEVPIAIRRTQEEVERTQRKAKENG